MSQLENHRGMPTERGASALMFVIGMAVFLTFVMLAFLAMGEMEQARIRRELGKKAGKDGATYMIELMNQLIAAQDIKGYDTKAGPIWPIPSTHFLWKFDRIANRYNYNFVEGFPKSKLPLPTAPIATLTSQVCNARLISLDLSLFTKLATKSYTNNPVMDFGCPKVLGKLQVVEAKKDGYLQVFTEVVTAIRLPTIPINTRLAELYPMLFFNFGGTEEKFTETFTHDLYPGKAPLPTKIDSQTSEEPEFIYQ